MKRKIALGLCLSLMLSLFSCAAQDADAHASDEEDTAVTGEESSVQLTEIDPIAVNYSNSALASPSPVSGEKMSGAFVEAAAKFGFDLLAECDGSGNTMISPVSVLYALGMTAGGAAGETKTQMEKTLFGGTEVSVVNRYFRDFADGAGKAEGAELSLANSIWLNRLRGDFAVNAEFLDAAASYYDAAVYGVPFGEDAVRQINSWVSEKTDGMIPETLNELSPADLAVLINTVLFDGKWEQEYSEDSVRQLPFTSYDGTKTEREMLLSTESRYFHLGDGIGFIRPYAEKYSFVGILPEEGKDVFEYTASIDGAEFVRAVKSPKRDTVHVRLPSFTFNFSSELRDYLVKMGMTDAFDSVGADFSGMGTCGGGNIFISNVLHKTRIELTKEGTKAAAVTAVMVKVTSAAPTKPPITVYLDRPFVFAIIDNESGLPLFCGVVSELK